MEICNSKARLKCAICKQQSEIKMRVRVGVANLFLDISIGIDENNTLLLKFLFGGRGKLFLGQSIMRGKLFLGQSIGIETNTFHQSIGIDENNTFHFYSSIKTVGTTVFAVCGRGKFFFGSLGGLWALEWAWHFTETNLRCVGSSGAETNLRCV